MLATTLGSIALVVAVLGVISRLLAQSTASPATRPMALLADRRSPTAVSLAAVAAAGGATPRATRRETAALVRHRAAVAVAVVPQKKASGWGVGGDGGDGMVILEWIK